jgi:hypothetical protein
MHARCGTCESELPHSESQSESQQTCYSPGRIVGVDSLCRADLESLSVVVPF